MEARPTDRVGLRGALAVLTALALFAGTLAATAPASDGGPSAQAAKKKCKKKKAAGAAKRKKCKKPKGGSGPGGGPQGAPRLTITPASYNWALGAPMGQQFSVTNIGESSTGALTTLLTGPQSAHFSIAADGCKGTSLDAGRGCNLTVNYVAPPLSQSSATLTVGGANGGTISAPLTGMTTI